MTEPLRAKYTYFNPQRPVHSIVCETSPIDLQYVKPMKVYLTSCVTAKVTISQIKMDTFFFRQTIYQATYDSCLEPRLSIATSDEEDEDTQDGILHWARLSPCFCPTPFPGHISQSSSLLTRRHLCRPCTPKENNRVLGRSDCPAKLP